MYRASSLSWLVKPALRVMPMLLVVTHRLWSIIGDSDSVVSSVGASVLAPLSFHALTGNLDRARAGRGTETASGRGGFHNFQAGKRCKHRLILMMRAFRNRVHAHRQRE